MNCLVHQRANVYLIGQNIDCYLFVSEKYEYVGRLLKPGEQPRDYSSDTEDEQPEDSSKEKGESEKKTD